MTGSAAPLEFTVDGLSCASCVGRAESALNALPGLSGASVNLATGRATVYAATPEAAQAVAPALLDAGYPAQPAKLRFDVSDMTCGSCVARVEAAVLAVPGVLSAQANLVDASVTVEALVQSSLIRAALASAGYPATLGSTAPSSDTGADEGQAAFNRFVIAAILTVPLLVLEMGGHVFPGFHHWLSRTIGLDNSWMSQFVLATAVLAWPGRVFFAKGVPALVRAAPDMNALVVLGTSAAWLYSTIAVFAPTLLPEAARAVYFEAAGVIVTLILLGRWLEARAKGRTGAAIERLIDLRPKTALVERDGIFADMPIEQIKFGDVIQLRPGERIAVDGEVTYGASFVDESMITGEPISVEKMEGSKLVGGTTNSTGAMTMRATAVGEDMVLAQIIGLVRAAQATRLPVQDIINRVTLWFVPAVMAIALLTAIAWTTLGPEPALSYAMAAAVSVLIIACPCAMGLATPTSIMVGMGRAAELGLLFRQGSALQSLREVDVVAFDKTGTLTKGTPELTDVVPLTYDRAALLRLVAAVEAMSEHPLAAPIVAATAGVLPKVQGFSATPGMGLTGEVEGQVVRIGTKAFLQGQGVDVTSLIPRAKDLAEQGKTLVFVALDGNAAGLLALSDTLRPEAAPTVAALRGMGLRVMLLSGDQQIAATLVADQLGITEVVAEAMPADKAAVLLRLQETGAKVAFVGDGINDAPALARADVGIAIGAGTDVALDSADVVLMKSDPAGILQGISLSHQVMRNIRQNLVWAFGYNILLIPVAAGALYPLWGLLLSPGLAAGAMALSSVLVVGNALRLRRAVD